MKIINPVPDRITNTFGNLLPTIHTIGDKKILLKDEVRHFYPPEFMLPLYWRYLFNIGLGRPFLIPKICLSLYKIVMGISNPNHLNAVVHNDEPFAKACGFSKGTKRIVGVFGLEKIQHELFDSEDMKQAFRESLDNLSNTLNNKKITFKGIIPSIWVISIRKPRHQTVDPLEYEAVFANDTGIGVIDELTEYIPLEFRSDIRQEAALNCLTLGLDKLSHDDMSKITKQLIRHSRNESLKAKYKTDSLFRKPYPDSNKEIWEMIADPTFENPEVLAMQKEEQELLKSINESGRLNEIRVIRPGDINCTHRISIDIDDIGQRIATCVHCQKTVILP